MNNYSYLFIALICNLACMSPAMKFSEEGTCITRTNGGYALTAQAVAEVDQSFQLVSWDETENDGFADAAFAGISLDPADALQEGYGCLIRDRNSGVRGTRGNVVNIRLITANDSCRKAVKLIREQGAGPDKPIIRISGREIRVSQATYQSIPTQFGNPPAVVLLADTIELKRERYSAR